MHGAVAYLSFAFKDGTTHCFFFFYGKVSICANRELQELNAVVIGIKLYNFAIHETELLIERKQVLVRPYANITVYTGWVTLL